MNSSSLLDRMKIYLAANCRGGSGPALASGARLLLLDEPLSALDAREMDLSVRIESITKDLGLTVLHVTHNGRRR